MMRDVIVFASGGEPVRLVAVESGTGLVYVANPGALGRIERGDTEPVGVLAADVVEYSEAKYLELREKWEASCGQSEAARS
jgi:hypothetical protein